MNVSSCKYSATCASWWRLHQPRRCRTRPTPRPGRTGRVHPSISSTDVHTTEQLGAPTCASAELRPTSNASKPTPARIAALKAQLAQLDTDNAAA